MQVWFHLLYPILCIDLRLLYLGLALVALIEAQDVSTGVPPSGLPPSECPEPCPLEDGVFEVEPCSEFFCSCSDSIGYLQVQMTTH